VSDRYIWAVIIGMAVANYVVRYPPIAILSRVHLPDPLRRWLSYIPVSVMAALVIGEVVRPDGRWLSPLANPFLWASVATGLVYWRFRSFLGATVAGVIFFLAFRATLG
jgi:branched-subunit amino acid transport protein